MGSQHESRVLHVIAQKTGKGGSRMNFTKRVHVFSTLNGTFLKTAGGFPQHTLRESSRCATKEQQLDFLGLFPTSFQTDIKHTYCPVFLRLDTEMHKCLKRLLFISNTEFSERITEERFDKVEHNMNRNL